jgi:dUTP pyrophosphatase
MNLPVKKLSDRAFLPVRSSDGAAGLDLYSSITGTIPSMGSMLVPLDIAIELPKGTFGHILPRSGLAVRHGIHIGAGVIDEDYRGNVSVLLCNFGKEEFTFLSGDRIAQLVVMPYMNVVPVEASITRTVRGENGFGSTGL